MIRWPSPTRFQLVLEIGSMFGVIVLVGVLLAVFG